jgi:hypothetical protein
MFKKKKKMQNTKPKDQGSEKTEQKIKNTCSEAVATMAM